MSSPPLGSPPHGCNTILSSHLGHCEKSICMIQCMIEFNLFCPKNILLQEDIQKKKELFEIFFDSHSPR